MKTKLAISAIALALTSSVAFADSVKVASGDAVIEGRVLSSSCEVDVAVAGTTVSTIKLADATVADFTAAGNNKPVLPTDFTITLKKCVLPEGQAAKLTWSAANPTAEGYLDNIATGAAPNVNVALLEGNDVINTGDVNNSSTAKDNVFSYSAAYISSNVGEVTGGLVKGQATYTISYN